LSLLNTQKLLGVSLQHEQLIGFGDIELFDLLRRVPVAEIVGVVSADHDVVDAAEADQIFVRVEAVDHVVVMHTIGDEPDAMLHR